MFSFLPTIKGQKPLVASNNLIFKFKTIRVKGSAVFLSFDFLSVGFRVVSEHGSESERGNLILCYILCGYLRFQLFRSL